MDRFESLEKMLEIVEAMKRNILSMMEDEAKSRLILARESLAKLKGGENENRGAAADCS